MRSHVALAAAAALFSSTTVQAASLADLGLSLEQVHELNAQLTAPVASPGIAFGSPIAFGANWGQAFLAVGGITDDRLEYDVDGSALIGLGLGNSAESVGVEVAATIISIFTDSGDAGAFNVKLHHDLPGRAAIALGMEQVGGWGDAQFVDETVYAVYTQAFELAPGTPRNPLTFTVNLGVGTERFRDPGEGGAAVFGGFSFHPHRQVSIIADWDGRDAAAALSVAPLRNWPVVLTLGAVNLAQRLGRDTEFAGGLGLLFNFD